MTSLWQAFIMISLCMHSARYHYGMQSRWYHYDKHSSWYHYDMHSSLWRDKIRPFTHHDIVTDYHISLACTASCYCTACPMADDAACTHHGLAVACSSFLQPRQVAGLQWKRWKQLKNRRSTEGAQVRAGHNAEVSIFF